MSAGSAAKGALRLVKWGKEIIPATDELIARFGPQASRVQALRNMAFDLSDDAKRISRDSFSSIVAKDLPRGKSLTRLRNAARSAGREQELDNAFFSGLDNDDYIGLPFSDALGAESISDRIVPLGLGPEYKLLTDPMATARRFDMTVSNAPESFTNIARSLGERNLILSPKDVETARRLSMLPPAMQQVYLDLVGEGTDPMQLIKALRLMGQ